MDAVPPVPVVPPRASRATRGDDWRPPWQSLPAELPDALAPALPEITADMIRTVPERIPAYASARDGKYGRNLALGVETALAQFMRLPGTGQAALSAESRALVATLGAGEFREGRSMDALFGAYRTCARIMFRELSQECARLGMEMSVVIDLGESIWAYIDELSAVSAQAYAEAQSAQAGVVELHRSELAAALLRGDAGEQEVERLAVLADWRLPEQVAVVVLPEGAAPAVRERLGRAGLVVDRDAEVVAIVDATPQRGRRARLTALLDGTGAVVGPAVPWDQAPHSRRVAGALVGQRGIDGDAPVMADEHLARVVVGAEPRVLEDLAARVLAPLDGVGPAKRDVYADTLLGWLEHWGARAPIATALNVHPQTVGYRVGRLRELFGDVLEDPAARFDLELVLRARRAGVIGS